MLDHEGCVEIGLVMRPLLLIIITTWPGWRLLFGFFANFVRISIGFISNLVIEMEGLRLLTWYCYFYYYLHGMNSCQNLMLLPNSHLYTNPIYATFLSPRPDDGRITYPCFSCHWPPFPEESQLESQVLECGVPYSSYFAFSRVPL